MQALRKLCITDCRETPLVAAMNFTNQNLLQNQIPRITTRLTAHNALRRETPIVVVNEYVAMEIRMILLEPTIILNLGIVEVLGMVIQIILVVLMGVTVEHIRR